MPDASDNSVKIIIEAKDIASQVIQTVLTSFNTLNAQSVNLSKSLLDSSLSLQKMGQQSTLINEITESFNNAAKSVSDYSANITNALKASLPNLQIVPVIDLSQVTASQKILTNIFDSISSDSRTAFNDVTDIANTAFKSIISIADTSVKTVSAFLDGLGEGIILPFVIASKISQNFFTDLQISVTKNQKELSKFGNTVAEEVTNSFVDLRSKAIDAFDAILPKTKEFLSLASPEIFASGIAIATGAISKTGDSAISTISNLIGLVNQLSNFLTSPIVQPFIETIAKQAEKATTATSSLSTILENTGTISKDFGKGFLNLGSGASDGVDKFAQDFVSKAFEKIAPAIDLVDEQITKAFENFSSLSKNLAEPLESLSNLPLGVSGIKEFQEIFGATEKVLSGVTSGISAVIEKVNFFGETMNNIQRIASTGAFHLLIGQAIELQQQLLSTQSSLVGTSKIIDGLSGKQIIDPKQAILSLQEPIENAIGQL